MAVSAICASSQMKKRGKIQMKSLHVIKLTVDSAVSVRVLKQKPRSCHTAGNQPVCSDAHVKHKMSTRGKRGRNSRRRKRDLALERY